MAHPLNMQCYIDEDPHLRASSTWQTVCPATAFQFNLQQGGVNNSCYVFEAATKQNSHYLPGCTWKGGDSTRQ